MTLRATRRAHPSLLRLCALVALASAAACGRESSAGGAGHPPRAAGTPVSVEEVHEQVRQFGLGGGEKDAAEEKLYDWGEAAAPGLIALARDPSVTEEELGSMMMIASLEVHTPEVYDALQARIATIPDEATRRPALAFLAQTRNMPGVPRP